MTPQSEQYFSDEWTSSPCRKEDEVEVDVELELEEQEDDAEELVLFGGDGGDDGC